MTTDQHVSNHPSTDGNEGDQPSWLAEPSALYLLRLALPDGRSALKLGFARDPQARLEALLRNVQIVATLLRVVPVASGKRAMQIEKRLLTELHRRFGHARVHSGSDMCMSGGFYAESVAQHLHACLDAVAVKEAEAARVGSRRRTRIPGQNGCA